jgi:selenocysteine lyase/cysteine desulfurase
MNDILKIVRRNEMGRGACIETPFGRRLLCHADLTATGRFLGFIEAWINRLRPYYANSHTVISTTGKLMTTLREEARDVIRRTCGAGKDDVVLFCGAGATAAVNKLVNLLGFSAPETPWVSRPSLPPVARPLVLVGPYEHHSNELPWAESIAEVIPIEETPAGTIDLAALEARLVEARAARRPLIVGSFSAASNVTGVISDVRGIARVLHRHGALAFFDFAASGPYVPIDMHPADPDERLDAVFISTHKFIGGPQGSGILIANRGCFRKTVPERPGGGTVDYVSYFHGQHHVDYSQRLDEREEGGTPHIIGDIRAGAAFLVKELMDPAQMMQHETEMAAAALARLARHPRIRLLGPRDLPRLPILSFNMEGLHHDFVSTLLDHLFGIQNRAGCACAGPYGHRLLSVTHDQSLSFRRWIRKGILGIKPGWTRITLPVYASPEDVDFILTAVEFVADHGDAFLPAYELRWRDAPWRHRAWIEPKAPAFHLTAETLLQAPPPADTPVDDETLVAARRRYLEEAHAAARALAKEHTGAQGWNQPTGCAEIDSLVWFKYLHSSTLPPDDAPPPRNSE